MFVVAGHKTGSTLLSKIIEDMALVTSVPAIPMESCVWSQGVAIKEWPDELYQFMENDGFIYYSFRWLQRLPELASFGTSRKIFMIRDPRDVAVSYYYSLAKSHSVPAAGQSRDAILKMRKELETTGIDDFIQSGKAGPILRNIERFSPYLDDPLSTFYRYEDVIFDKRNWVARVAGDLGIELTREQAEQIADRHDILPETENPNAHIRSVRPGGYVEKLAPGTIEFIKGNHPTFFGSYGYH